jgi:DNA-binding GntR family transcriptional regulator
MSRSEDASAKITFARIRSRRTFEEVCSEIKKLIIKGILRPGNKLPSESELARQFGVGRQTIREGLRLLELSGFITIQKGSAGGPIFDKVISLPLTLTLFLPKRSRK